MASHPAAQGEAEEPRQIRGGRMTGRCSWRVARSGCLPLSQNVILKTSVINTCLQKIRIDHRGTLMKHMWPLWHHNGISSKASKRRNLAAPLWGFYWPGRHTIIVTLKHLWGEFCIILEAWLLSVVTRECCSNTGVMVKKSGSPAFCCVPFSLRGTQQTPDFVIRQMR